MLFFFRLCKTRRERAHRCVVRKEKIIFFYLLIIISVLPLSSIPFNIRRRRRRKKEEIKRKRMNEKRRERGINCFAAAPSGRFSVSFSEIVEALILTALVAARNAKEIRARKQHTRSAYYQRWRERESLTR